MSYVCAFVLSSWVIGDAEIKGTLTEGMFGLYRDCALVCLVDREGDL